jgi:gliding motility-associated-like protein
VLTPWKVYAAAGTYNVKVDAITKVGCIATVTEPLELKGPAAFDFVSDTVRGCSGRSVTLAISNPEAGVVYNWYDTETGGAIGFTGASRTINPLNATVTYYVSAVKDGCTTKPRKAVTAFMWPVIAVPVVRVDTVGINMIRFAWTAVQQATGYQVSTDNGITWITPSSGATGLTHTVTGLQGGQRVTLRVKALDPNSCADGISAELVANTLPGQLFIPNAFSPNNDGLNDEFKVEGYIIRSMQLRVFNQWGEMVFEANDQNRGWDGKHKGKLQPSGVYMYVCSMVLNDGTKEVRKGAVNLVR